MHLHRVTPDAFENNWSSEGKYLGKEVNSFKPDILQFDGEPAVQVVVARFERFGGGEHRKSDYEVLSEWRDVEKMITKFCEIGHPEALALLQARRLADAVKLAGWRGPENSN